MTSGGAERSEAKRFCLPRLYPTFRLKGRLTAENYEDQAVEDAGDGAVDDDGAGDDEHFRGHAGDEALWLCQDRHTVFSEFFQLPPKWGRLLF